MHTIHKLSFSIALVIICIIIFSTGIYILIKQEGFEQREVYKEADTKQLLAQLYSNGKTRAYLNNLIAADYIQSYPWFANNPNGATTYNMRLFNQSNDTEQIEAQSQNYYDFGEITYIGNPL